jgi:RNA polymerase sigma-70 factor, ECF subfamily
MSAEFKHIFNQYFDSLVDFATLYTENHAAAEDVVQSVFLRIWENQTDILSHDNPQYYLYRAVKNRCLNYLRDIKKMATEELDIDRLSTSKALIEEQIEVKELSLHIDRIINELPPACRRVFLMSRKEQLSHKEIAELLDISVKTIENQITHALKHLRSKIK